MDILRDGFETDVKEQLTVWVGLYHKDLLRWAEYKVNDKENAKDLVQDTFLAAYNGIKRFKGESSPRTWLFRILNHKIVDFYRGKSKTPSSLDEDVAFSVTESMFDHHQNWELNGFESNWESGNLFDNPVFVDVFGSCMEDLPETWSKILSDKYFFEKKSEQVCQENGISPTNYWQILHRAKLLMKKCIENMWSKS
jgi:RNA polymerase sigma-70 factor (TIGR02943 family)